MRRCPRCPARPHRRRTHRPCRGRRARAGAAAAPARPAQAQWYTSNKPYECIARCRPCWWYNLTTQVLCEDSALPFGSRRTCATCANASLVGQEWHPPATRLPYAAPALPHPLKVTCAFAIPSSLKLLCVLMQPAMFAYVDLRRQSGTYWLFCRGASPALKIDLPHPTRRCLLGTKQDKQSGENNNTSGNGVLQLQESSYGLAPGCHASSSATVLRGVATGPPG